MIYFKKSNGKNCEILISCLIIFILEQDTGLENLSKIISRQKNIATAISEEVDYHNGIILYCLFIHNIRLIFQKSLMI